MPSSKTLKQHISSSGEEISQIIHSFAMHSMHMQEQFPKYLQGVENDKNKYGEAVAKLDSWANSSLIECLKQTGLIRKIYSEELKEPMDFHNNAPYVATLDPLDGSSNISTNNIFGIILGLYKQDLPQPGKNLAGAAIKIYGPVNTLIYSTGNGAHEFVKHYDKQDKPEFFLLHENIKFPKKPEVFGIGGDPLDWDSKFMLFAKSLFKKEKLKARYCGSFVGDFSQIIHRGGFFAYPSTKKSPRGKLRLTYEANPISFIAENAGGSSYDGKTGSILNVQTKEIDSRIPVYVGNKELIEKLKQAL
ncbi:MAG: class 1 fructose-bisphosphatase [Candidatus Micrarchaeota archaeon]